MAAKITIDTIYASRCENGKPKYWKPTDLPAYPLKIEDQGVPEVLQRVLASGLQLELDVREWVSECWRKLNAVDESNLLTKLLLSNIADESVHYHQLKKASKVLEIPEKYQQQAAEISETFENHPASPLEKAALIERGYFIPASLAPLLKFGGLSLGWTAQMIGVDEQRHSATNIYALKKLGYDPFKPPPSLIKVLMQALDWLLDGLNVIKLGINKDWLIKQSLLMIEYGNAPDLSAWTSAHRYKRPFETENRMLVY